VSVVPTTAPSWNCWVVRIQRGCSGGSVAQTPVSASNDVVDACAPPTSIVASSTHAPRFPTAQSVATTIAISTRWPA
jgi:hypothetical protein